MRKIAIIFMIVILMLGLAGCKKPVDHNKDNIAPLFVKAKDGNLPSIRHRRGEQIDLLADIEVIDNLEGEVKVEIVDDGGYDYNKAGVYIMTIEAIDLAGNKSTATLKVSVLSTMTNVYDALIINDNASEYVYNNELALNYTSSGTAFRSQDVIQVMEKDFFVNLFNEKKGQHTNNGQIPFVLNGVVVLIDLDFNLKHMRIAAETIEVNALGEASSTNLNWNNAIDATNGGGNFKNILTAIEENISSGGYVIFTGSPGEQISKKFLIKNLFFSQYEGGVVKVDQYNSDFKNLKIELVDGYEEEIPVIEDEDPVGELLIKNQYLDGIPVTTYYFNDNKPKPVIFFFHGFSSNRKDGLMGRGEELAKRGFFVVAMDAFLHGERQPSYFASLSNAEKQQEIVNIQIQTAKDAQMLFEKYFKNNKYVNDKEVYAYGVSMGAGSAFYLGTIMDEVSTIISIVGSPSLYEFYKEKTKTYHWTIDSYYQANLDYYFTIDPLINYNSLASKNIFMGNGSQDTVVPAKFAKELSEKINHPNVVFKLYNTIHSSTPAMLNDAYMFLESKLNS